MPQWAGNPERILYLIDTTNGELHIQRNIVSVNRDEYYFYDYGTTHTWGESIGGEHVRNKMPVMTYAGFGSEMRNHFGAFPWERFDYIVCDEMQNLVRYQKYKKKKTEEEKKTKEKESEDKEENIYLAAAEDALRAVARLSKIKIVALSATPQKIRKHFGELCYDVPFDRSDLHSLETFNTIPYECTLSSFLKTGIPPANSHQTGIIYVTEIATMKQIFKYCLENGIHANGFWSINAKEQMSKDQLALRETVLADETIPSDIDLLVINAASETCIKVDGKKRKVDYMIIHNKDEEVRTQVRGRYDGDLPCLYYHNIDDTNLELCRNLPERFLNMRLYCEAQEELCAYLRLRNPKKSDRNDYYKMRKVSEYLQECGYLVEYKKDSKNGGKHYYVVTKE